MFFIKILISSVIIASVSEVAKKSGKLGGLILSLPLTSLLALLLIWIENKDALKVAQVSSETLIFVLPSLVFFLVLPLCIHQNLNFYLSFAIAIISTLFAYFLFYHFRGEF